MADCNQDEGSKYKKNQTLRKIADVKKKNVREWLFFSTGPFCTLQGRRIRKSGNQLTMNEWMMNDMNDMNDIFFILQ